MPVYRVDLPDGTAYKVESDHDLTDEQVHAALGFSQSQPTEQPQSSAGSAFSRGVGANVGKGGGAAAGAAYGASLGAFGGPLDPVTIPLGAGIGALAGGYLGQKGQELVQGEQYTAEQKAQLQADAQTHPIASGAGQMAAQLPSMLAMPATGIAGMGGKVADSALGGVVFGAGQAGGDVAAGNITPGQVPGEIAKTAITMAPLGLIPGATSIAGKYLARPAAEAATLAAGNVAYDAATGKGGSVSDVVNQTGQNLPGFIGLNALAGLLHGHAKPLEAGKTGDSVAHENVPTEAEQPPVEAPKPEAPVDSSAGSQPPAVETRDIRATVEPPVRGSIEQPEVLAESPPADGGGTGGEQGTLPVGDGRNEGDVSLVGETGAGGDNGQGRSEPGAGATAPPEPGPVAPGGERIPINHASTADLRQQAGLSPRPDVGKRPRAMVDAEADHITATVPGAVDKLIADLKADPERTHKDWEESMLERATNTADKEAEAAATAKIAADATGDPAKAAAAHDHYTKTLDRLKELIDVDEKTGTAAGRSLASRGNRNVGDVHGVQSLPKTLLHSEAKKGAPLSKVEVADITKEHESYTKERAKVEANIQEGREAEDRKHAALLTAEVKAEMRANPEEAARIRVGGLSERLSVPRKPLPEIPGALKPRTGDIKPDAKLPGDIAQHALHGIGILERVWNIALPSAKLAIKKVTGKDFGRYAPAERAVHVGEKQTIHTAIHEVAHWLDHALGGRDYASRQASGSAKELASRMTQSDGMRAARQTLARSDISPFLRAHLNYLLKPEEMFARAVEHATAKLGGLPEPQYDPITNLYAKLTSVETDAIVPHVKAALERFERPTETGRSESDASTSPERAANEGVAANADGDSARNSATGLAGEEVGIQEARSAADPEEDKTKLDGKTIKELYKAHIKANLEKPLSRAELENRAVADAQKIWPDASPREIRDTFSDYMKVSYPSEDKLKAQEAEMRTQSKWVSRLEDLEKGITRRFGLQRRPPSDETRSLARQVRDKMRALGIRVVGPENLKGAKDAVLTRLRNSITDNMAIIEGRMKPKTPKEKMAHDAETLKLHKHNAELNAYILDLTGPNADHVWNQQREKAYRAAESDWQKRSAEGDLERRKSGSKYEPSEKTKAAQADALKAKEAWEALREASGIIGKEKLEAYKQRLQRSINENNRKVATGEFYKKSPEELKIDRETQELQYKQRISLHALERAKRKAEMSNRSDAQKMADTLVGWRRGELLSGYHVLAKLSAAAIARHIVTPIDELAGSALKRLSPSLAKVSEMAPRHGSGFDFEQESKALADGITTVMRHYGDILKTGQTPADAHSGKAEMHDLEHYWGKPVLDFFGHMHVLLKTSAKEAEFSRSLQKRIAHEMKKGDVDTKDPIVMEPLMMKALRDAKREVFQQQNFVSQSWKNTLRMLESSKLAPRAGKVAATIGRVLIPISTVPTNFIGEAINRTPVGLIRGAMELRGAIKKGLDTLHEDDADKIMRHLKQGSVGTGLMLLGYLAPQIAGGYFQAGQKQKEGELHPGDIGFKGSHLFMHNSAAEVITMGATARKVADHVLQGHPEGFVKGLAQSFLGLGAQMPFIRTPGDVANVVTGKPSEQSRTVGNLVQGLVVPRLAAEIAQDTDSVASRKMRTVPDYLKGSIPGLRHTLPVRSVH